MGFTPYVSATCTYVHTHTRKVNKNLEIGIWRLDKCNRIVEGNKRVRTKEEEWGRREEVFAFTEQHTEQSRALLLSLPLLL
jgi:hypothetical protein